MNQEEIIEQLRANFIALSKIQSLKDAYKITGYVFNLLQKLELLDKTLSEKLSSITANISQSTDFSNIQDLANSALALLASSKIKQKRYLKLDNKVESDDFIFSKEKYANIRYLIDTTKEKLEVAEGYVPNLHRPIKRGKYAKCLHAHVNENIRIMYILDPEQKKLIYIDIISKNDFENSLNIKQINWIEKYKEL